jgi:membrane-associated phospholipid phosphatase
VLKQEKIYSSYNPFFFIPFFLWSIIGALAIMLSDKESLFRVFNTNYNSVMDGAMPVVTMMGNGVVITIILAVLLTIPKLQNRWYFLAALFSALLSSLFVQLVKNLVNAERPLKFFSNADWLHTLPAWEQNMHYSFPSGHSCGAFSMFSLLACLLPLRFRFWGALFFVLALLVGYSRMYLAQHFFEDVYAGSIVGTLFTTFIVSMLRRNETWLLKGKAKSV